MAYVKKYDKVFVSLEEATELEQVKYNTFIVKINRNIDKFIIKKEKSETGGKERTFISVSSLSVSAQRKYKSREQKEKLKEQEAKEIEPWYTLVDFNWYKNNYESHYYKAVELAHTISKHFDNFTGKISIVEKQIAEVIGVNQRSIRRYLKDYIEATNIVNKKEIETGQDYSYLKILAVARKVKLEENFTTINDEMKVFIENLYYDKNFALNNNPVTNLYDDFVKWSITKEFESIPHYNTVLRYTKYLENTDGKGVRELASKGLRTWKNTSMMKRFRDTKALQVLEIVQGDVHTFDVWVSVKRANGKFDAIRPCLVAWIDMRSRALVGWVISECPNADIMKQSLINVIYPKANSDLPYGVPKYLLIDNGKEYTAQSLTGRPRNERVCFDEDAKGFYRSIGIIDDIRSLPYQPWSKAQVERYFSTVEMKFGKRMKSYTGTLTGSKTSGKVNKDIKSMLERGELLDIEDFAQKFEEWVVNEFHSKTHRGLIRQGEETKEPITTFNTADKYFKVAPPIDYAISLLMKGETRVVTNMGIKRTVKGQEIWYTNSELMRYQGERVEFKYYPSDITKVLVYDENGKYICEAISYELLHISPKLSEDALIEHIKDQKRQQSETVNTIKQRRLSYEERQEIEYSEAGKKVVAPALSKEEQKAVAFVNDNRYLEDKKARKNKSDEINTSHQQVKANSKKLAESYLLEKGKEVYEEVKNLG